MLAEWKASHPHAKLPLCPRAQLEKDALDVLNLRGQYVALDRTWLANTLMRAVGDGTGTLQCDRATLARVWPDSEGFTDEVRRWLLEELLTSSFVLPFWGRGEDRCLLPVFWPRSPLVLNTVLIDGESEAGVQYELVFLPRDFWTAIVAEFAELETCSRDSIVLHCHGQRGLLVLDSDTRRLSLVVRGSDPMRLRRTFHGSFMDLMKRRFPTNVTSVVHVLCHVCHKTSELNLKQHGEPFFCSHEHGKQDVDEGVLPQFVIHDMDFISAEIEEARSGNRKELARGDDVWAKHCATGKWLRGKIMAKQTAETGGVLYTVKYDVTDEDYFEVILPVADLLEPSLGGV